MNYKKLLLNYEEAKEGRVQAAFFLSIDIDKDSLEILARAMMTDPSPVVRHELAFILGEIKLTEAGEYLVKLLEKDSEAIVKHKALSALGSLGDTKYLSAIEKYLSHHDGIIRESAEMAVERIQRYKGGVSLKEWQM